MKKRLLTLLSATVLCGMVSGCCISHDWQEATCTAPKTCAKCGETEGEPLAHTWVDATCTEAKHCSVCGTTEGEPLPHEWVEATYETPKTCSVCGTTEGEPKQSYFAEYGVDVPDGPIKCTVDYLYLNRDNPETYCRVGDATYTQTECYVTPADEEGYQNLYLTVKIALKPGAYYDAAQDVEYLRSATANFIYDWYTGRKLPSRTMLNNDAQENSVTLEIDGASYEVSCSTETEIKQGDWTFDGKGNGTSKINFTVKYIFRIPEGYDGLVYAVMPQKEYNGVDMETVFGQEEAVYAPIDQAGEDYVEDMQFFRINHTELPVKEGEDTSDTSDISAATDTVAEMPDDVGGDSMSEGEYDEIVNAIVEEILKENSNSVPEHLPGNPLPEGYVTPSTGELPYSEFDPNAEAPESLKGRVLY